MVRHRDRNVEVYQTVEVRSPIPNRHIINPVRQRQKIIFIDMYMNPYSIKLMGQPNPTFQLQSLDKLSFCNTVNTLSPVAGPTEPRREFSVLFSRIDSHAGLDCCCFFSLIKCNAYPSSAYTYG